MVINICMEIWFMMKLGFFIGKKKKKYNFFDGNGYLQGN